MFEAAMSGCRLHNTGRERKNQRIWPSVSTAEAEMGCHDLDSHTQVVVLEGKNVRSIGENRRVHGVL